jgi:hypothetical protein
MRARLLTVVLAGLTAASLCGCSGTGSATPPGSPGTTAVAGAATLAATIVPIPGATAATSATSATATASTAATTAVGPQPGAPASVPLWPFTTVAQARSWQASYRSGGHQPWHLDAAATALGFTRGHLGYTAVDRVTTQRVNGTDAHIGVGWSDPELRSGPAAGTAAVLHLVRLGAGADAPWVVVGSDDTSLTLDHPRYGAVVPPVHPLSLQVGGLISGVDESLRVIVLGTSTTPLARSAPLSSGGTRVPWSTSLSLVAPSGSVLTVAVSTGGHLRTVERFAITAVRVA